MKRNVIYKDNDKNYSVSGLIISMLILLLLIIGLIIFILMSNTSSETSTISDVNKEYDALLMRLNSYISVTEVEEGEKATSLISFTFKDDTFYISGVNETKVYDYQIDLSKKNYDSISSAYEYVINHELSVGQFDMEIYRYTKTSSNEFNVKYHSSSMSYGIGVIGEQTRVFMTSLDDDMNISMIYGEKLSDTLLEGYIPMKIDKSDSLYDIYKLIAMK